MSRLVLAFVLVSSPAALAGCAGSLGTFDTMGFIHDEYPYTVEYRAAGQQTFINNDWRLENFYTERGELKPKHGDEHETTTHFDVDGNGTYETSREVYLYDLRFEHKSREQSIWIRTLPIATPDAEKNLDVIMRDYLALVSGSGYAIVNLSEKSVQIVEKRYATQLLGQRSFKLAGRDALLVTFDVANVDQLSVNTQERKQRVALLFVRTGYELDVGYTGHFPVIMVVGYAANPDDFDQGLPAYEYFTTRVTLRLGKNRTVGMKTLSDEDVRALPGASLALRRGTVAALLPAASVAEPAPATPAPQPPAVPAPADSALPPPAAPAPEPATPVTPAT